MQTRKGIPNLMPKKKEGFRRTFMQRQLTDNRLTEIQTHCEQFLLSRGLPTRGGGFNNHKNTK